MIPIPPGFVFADEFLLMVRNFRVLWICGRYGGYKTSLAVWLAEWLLNKGDVQRISSNIDIVNGVNPVVPLQDTALVVDEAGIFLQSWKQAKDFLAFLRKRNLILLLPSVYPVAAALQILRVQMIMNMRVIGLPVIVYRWDLAAGKIREKGYFGLGHPEKIFGFYDTNSEPTNADGILEAIRRTQAIKQPASPSPAGPDSAGTDSGDIGGSLESATAAITDATSEFAEMVTKAGHRLRR